MRRFAVMALAALLTACGGGGGSGGSTGPVSVPVTPTPTPSAGNTSSGTTQTGSLQYLVFSSGSATVASSTSNGTPIAAAIDATANTITFPAGTAPLSAGLTIGAAGTNNPTFNSIASVGGTGAQGNGFLWCGAGIPPSVTRQVSQAGTIVGISGNMTALSDIAPLYGRTFTKRDCAGDVVTVRFGDGNGNMTLQVNSLPAWTPAQVLAAFTSSGVQLDANTVIRLKAYSITISGTATTVIVALIHDNSGNSGAIDQAALFM